MYVSTTATYIQKYIKNGFFHSHKTYIILPAVARALRCRLPALRGAPTLFIANKAVSHRRLHRGVQNSP